VYVTRRYWAGLTLAALLIGGGVAFEPLLLVGSGGLLAYLLVGQVLFARAAARVRADLSVDRSVGGRSPVAGRTAPTTLSVSLAAPTRLAVAVGQSLPSVATAVGADPAWPVPGARRGVTLSQGDDRSTLVAEITPGSDTATATRRVGWAVAGRYALAPPTVVTRDRSGLFVDVATVGDAAPITVAPGRPDATIGRGGRGVVSTDRPDFQGLRLRGDDPGETREYVPGDTLSLIDWKATARLGRLHVRELAGTVQVSDVLVVDARARLATGPAGRTKLEHLRGVALTLLDRARAAGDPIALTVVSDDGTETVVPIGGSDDHYSRIRRHLYDLSIRPDAGSRRTARGRTPGQAAAAAAALGDDSSPFAATLRPFFGGEDRARTVREDPLFQAVRTVIGQTRRGMAEATNIALLTDDADRPTLEETVGTACAAGCSVSVFLAGDVLFDVSGAASLADWRARRASLERFRRALDRRRGVEAFEVGPRGHDPGRSATPLELPADATTAAGVGLSDRHRPGSVDGEPSRADPRPAVGAVVGRSASRPGGSA
jgi:uncharacterized protein (DUF58 family)